MIQRVGFRHLLRLTDDVGLLEHAHYLIPRREEGYTTDDNARALWCVLWWLQILPQGPLAKQLQKLAEIYLAFVRWNQLENGRFYNNIDYTLKREPESPSDDCFGRTLWALAYTAVHGPHPFHRQLAQELIQKAMPHAEHENSPRGYAFTLAACALLANTSSSSTTPNPVNQAIDGQLSARAAELIPILADRLADLYKKSSDDEWRWFEPHMTYSNGLLPWGMLVAGRYLQEQRFIQIGLHSLHFLIEKMRHPTEGFVEPVGNRQWCSRTVHSIWDQQPIDVFKLALALSEAWQITDNPEYSRLLLRCRQWFHGDNRLRAVMCLPDEGAGLDGLTENGPNANAGAESTLSYLLTERLFLDYIGQSSEAPAYRIEVDDDTVYVYYPNDPSNMGDGASRCAN